jgi:AcrR family transcriptional regulator
MIMAGKLANDRSLSKLGRMPRRSQAEAALTHDAILERAVAMASTDGLEGLTIGRLATDMRMSKAGVIGHFGSKEKLQLEALERAIADWRAEVWEPVAGEDPGLPRLHAIARRWSEFLGDCPFPGGCFLTAASFEFDDRPGPVRDRVREALGLWLRVLAADARNAGLKDPAQVAFELNAIAMGTNHAVRLQGDPKASTRCRKAMERVLGA